MSDMSAYEYGKAKKRKLDIKANNSQNLNMTYCSRVMLGQVTTCDGIPYTPLYADHQHWSYQYITLQLPVLRRG